MPPNIEVVQKPNFISSVEYILMFLPYFFPIEKAGRQDLPHMTFK